MISPFIYSQIFTVKWSTAGNGYCVGDMDNDQIGEIAIEPHPTISQVLDILDGSTQSIKWTINKNSDEEYLYSDFSTFRDYNGNGVKDIILITLGQFSGDDQILRVVDPSNGETLFSFSNPATLSSTAYFYYPGLSIANVDGGSTLEMIIRSRNDSLYIYGTNLTVSSFVDNNPIQPGNFRVEQNFPNPFNPSTTIRYSIQSPEKVSIRIYDISGQIVREFNEEHTEAGNFEIIWDGRNNFGEKVSSAAYFYQVSAGEFVESKKMILIK